MKSSFQIVLLFILCTSILQAKEIALTFDDAPMGTTKHFETHARANELIRKLKQLSVPPVIIFTNACRREDTASVIQQMKKYKDAGHLIGNHTCTHPRLDEVGFATYAKDAEKGDQLLSPLFPKQKFFRYPFLNEGKDETTREQMRAWLKENHYKHGMVSVDNDDYIFSFKINDARNKGKKFSYKKVQKLFLEHVVGAAQFYDDLAVKTLGYSPKHVLLLHEMDATVMFLDSLVKELRKQGWTIISAEEAYKDKLYEAHPKNTYSGNGILSQLVMEKTGQKVGYYHFDTVKAELNRILGL